MERGLMMVLHSLLIGIVVYFGMVYGLQQSPMVAENRSVVIGAVVLLYMVVFGHGLPGRINPML